MINSMTGFGRGVEESETIRYTVEIKTVNHRFLDINVKLPSYAFSIEDKVQKTIREKVERGKIDVVITIKAKESSGKAYAFDKDTAKVYFDAAEILTAEKGLENDLTVSKILDFPGVVAEKDMSSSVDSLWDHIEKALNTALDRLALAREAEGENLCNDLMAKMDELSAYACEIEKRAPEIITEYKEKLMTKMADLLADNTIDESRIAAEVVIFSDKICIDEELVRLKSHIKAFKDTLNIGGPVGRKLDFLSQELNREANTILSKSSDSYTANIGIEVKTLIEKIREQVQNLE